MSDMQIQTLSEANNLTMSSREIAERCGKQHKHVLRDIRVMLISLYGEDELEKIVPEKYRNRHSEYMRENADAILARVMGDGPDLDHKFRGYKWKRDNRGYVVEFNLDKAHTITLASGYSVKLRKRIVDRWMELEQSASQPPQLDDPNWLRGTLLTYTEKVLALQSQVDELLPSHQALERIAEADGSMCITDAAKALQMRPKDLFTFMRTNGWIYKRSGSSYYVGYQSKTTQGLLEHKVTTVYRSDGTEKVTEQVRVTPKGLTRLAKLINPAMLQAA